MKGKILHILIITAVLIGILYIFHPLLLPLVNNKLSFLYGDLVTNILPDSSKDILQKNFYVFDEATSTFSFEHIRYSPLFTLVSALGALLNRNEAFIVSLMSLISIITGYFGFYKLFKHTLDIKNAINYLLYIVLVFFFFFNFYSITRINHIYLWHTYLVLPLQLYLGLSFCDDKNRHKVNLFLYSLVLITWGLLPHGILYMGLIHVILSIRAFTKNFSRGLALTIFPMVLYGIFNIPFIFSQFTPSGSYPIKITITQLDFLSKNGSIKNTLAFLNNWWLFVNREKLFSNNIYIFSGLIISTLALVILITNFLFSVFKKDKKSTWTSIFILVILAIIVFISAGMSTTIMQNIVLYLDKVGILGSLSVFREWGRIALLLPILIIFIICNSAKFFEKSKIVQAIFFPIISIAIVANLSQLPIYEYLYKVHNPVEIPTEYISSEKTLNNGTKTVWISPSIPTLIEGNQVATWDNSKVPDKIPEYISESYSISNSTQPLLFSYIENNESTKLFEYLNIGSTVTRNDILSEAETSESLLDIKQYSNKSNQSYILPNDFVYLVDPTRDVSNLPKLLDLGINVAPIDSEDLYKKKYLLVDLNELEESYLLDQYLLENPDEGIYPGKEVDDFDPDNSWSSGTTRNVLHSEITPYLNSLAIYNYQKEYSDFILFTYTKPKIDENSFVTYISYDLSKENVLKEFNSINDVEQFGSRYSIKKDTNGMSFTLNKMTPNWKTISTPKFEVETGEYIQIKMNLKLSDAIEPHLKIFFYDGDHELVGYDYLENLVQYNNKDFFDISIDYFINSYNAKFCEISLWHGNSEVDNSISQSTIILKEIEILKSDDEYEYEEFKSKNDIYIKDESYIYARLLFSPEGNKVVFNLGDKEIEIDTHATQSKYKWVQLGTFYSGKYSLKIHNKLGLNAIDTLVVYDAQDFKDIQKKYEDNYYYQFDNAIYKLTEDGAYTLSIKRNIEYRIIKTDSSNQIVINEPFDISDEELVVSSLEPDSTLWIIPDIKKVNNEIDPIKLTTESPIKLNGKVTTTTPGEIIIFNELFDKNWILSLQDAKTGKITKVEPSSAFSITNAYLIKNTGEYNISFEYKYGNVYVILKYVTLVLYLLLLTLILILTFFKHNEKSTMV